MKKVSEWRMKKIKTRRKKERGGYSLGGRVVFFLQECHKNNENRPKMRKSYFPAWFSAILGLPKHGTNE